MSEILTKHGRMIERLSKPGTIASTVFHGHATDMNVHPTFEPDRIQNFQNQIRSLL